MISGTWCKICLCVLWGFVHAVVRDTQNIWFAEAEIRCFCQSWFEVERRAVVPKCHQPLLVTLQRRQDNYFPDSSSSSPHDDRRCWSDYEFYRQSERLFLVMDIFWLASWSVICQDFQIQTYYTGKCHENLNAEWRELTLDDVSQVDEKEPEKFWYNISLKKNDDKFR